MGAPVKYNTDMCIKAQKVLADGESLAAVCAELDITRTTLYDWRETYPEFDEACKKGLMKAQRDWERIGREGIMGNLEKFSASPWIFTMKNRFRADYAEDKEDKSTSQHVIDSLIDKLVDK